jgi:hypothetical protein
LFIRDYLNEVYYNTVPREEEIKNKINIFASLGEYEPFTFAVYPLTDLRDVEVTVDDFISKDEAKISKDNVDIRVVKYLARGIRQFIYKMAPEALFKFKKINIKNGITTQFWFIIKIPEDAKGGIYKSKITFKPSNGEVSSIDVNLEVLPFKLIINDTLFGWYYSGGSDETHLRRELRDMKEHGFNAMTTIMPKIAEVSSNSVNLDFKEFENFMKICKEEGMIVNEGNISNFVSDLVAKGYKELSPQFCVLCKDAVAKTQKWLENNGYKNFLFEIFDEPRESVLNPWNRNMEDTVKYLKLCKEIPEVKTTVIIMADKQDGKDYTQMVPFIDVVNTHHWEKSKGLIKKTKELGKVLFTNNNGYSRLSWGFDIWKAGIKGRWQYCYTGYSKGNKVFSPVPTSFENEGSSNTGVVYSTINEIIPSIKYEWVREGIDDYRYITTLEYYLEKLKNNTDAKGLIENAGRVIDELKKVIPEYPSTGLITGREAGEGEVSQEGGILNNLRWKIAKSILELSKIKN